jgi:hypothetical protein
MDRKVDKYLSDYPAIKRLVMEWVEHGELVIAYDYDNTVFDYHDEGITFDYMKELLTRCKNIGAKFIVFSCSPKDRHEEMRGYLVKNDFPCDYINESPIKLYNDGTGKLFFNILLDDRAGLRSAFIILDKVCDIMEQKPSNKVEACHMLNERLSYKLQC